MRLFPNQAFTAVFAVADAVRRTQAEALRAIGFGATECDYCVIASTSLWRLRRYAGSEAGPTVLIVAAPIKRPYIWDLAPSASAVRYCLQHGLRVYLLEWRPPSRRRGTYALAEYADGAIPAAVAAVSSEIGRSKPFLMGHSLGGTFAAISAVLHAKHLSGLVLLSAPLCVYPGASPYWDALATIAPFCLPELEIIPGSVLSQLSAMASPETFVWSRLLDAGASAADPRTSAIRLLAERWALDEVPLSGQLVREVFLWLCRENRFCKGTLALGGRAVRPCCVRLPTLAVANAIDEIAPPASVSPFLKVMSQADTHLIEYPGEFGVVLQHLGILLGQHAFTQTWPKIISWITAHGGTSGTKRNRRV